MAVPIPVNLAKTTADLKTCFGLSSDGEVMSLLRHPEKLSDNQAAIWKYSGGSLCSGRSMDSTFIVMAGASGAGKSSTINALFTDNSLCKTNENESETSKITLIRKSLEITKESPPIQTTLNFVDVPGMFDTDARNEAGNIKTIQSLKSSLVELQSRTDIPVAFRYYYSISKQSYPNLVLFVVNASDNRMGGADSKLMKSLRILRNSGNLIDTNKVNLIVVLTHVMSLTRRRFSALLQERKEIVRKAVYTILNLHNVEVVAIENQPEDYDLEKSGDYYKLPTGEFSHLNLFQAMQTVLNQNGDLLARLSISWYYNTDCPDREKAAEVMDVNAKIPEDLNNLVAAIGSAFPPDFLDTLPKMYNMQCLGFGFCPVTEQVRSMSPLKEATEPEIVEVGSTKFRLPLDVTVISNPESRFSRMSCFSKQDYEQHMIHSYELDAGLTLAVRASSKGKWIENQVSSEQHSLLSVLHETKMGIFRIKDPETYPKTNKFIKEINNLQGEFTKDTKEEFRTFFSRWGTHFISEVQVGGSVQMNCTLKQKAVTKENLSDIQSNICSVFHGIFCANAEHSMLQQVGKLRSIGVEEEHLQIVGGDPPPFISLETINGEKLEEWSRSVASKPTELRRSMKLFPYYKLVEGKQAKALREATEDYLKNSAKEQMEQIFLQNDIANDNINQVVEAPPKKGSCFPRGTLISLEGGGRELIENLGEPTFVSKLESIRLSGKGEKLKFCGEKKSTRFCTYLDVKKTELTDYLALNLSNGKKLLVSPGHMIFQYLGNDMVRGKQVKYFQLGDQVVFSNSVGAPGRSPVVLEYPTIQEITEERHVGAYCPLTTSGTFFADGVFVSSYTNTDFFQLGQASLAPLKLYSLLPLKPRNQDNEGIHPYAKFLISARKALTLRQLIK